MGEGLDSDDIVVIEGRGELSKSQPSLLADIESYTSVIWPGSEQVSAIESQPVGCSKALRSCLPLDKGFRLKLPHSMLSARFSIEQMLSKPSEFAGLVGVVEGAIGELDLEIDPYLSEEVDVDDRQAKRASLSTSNVV